MRSHRLDLATEPLELIAELRSTLLKMDVALDAISEAVVWTDEAGRVQGCSASFDQFIGRQRIEILGEGLCDLLPLEQEGQPVTSECHPVTIALRSKHATTGFYASHSAGQKRTLEIFATPVHPRNDETSAVLVIRDMTERKQAEMALRDSEARYHSLVENIPLHVCRKDQESRFTFANQRFCESLGKLLEQILGKTDLDFYPEHLAAKYRRDDHRVLETGEIFEDVEQHQKPDGERLYVAVVKTPVYDAKQQIVGTQCMFWDVTVGEWAKSQKEQLRVARAIQHNLLPSLPPEPGDFDFGAACFPAEATAGDYFDFIPLRDGSIGVVVGDVSGHGFGPALIAAVTHACLRTVTLTRSQIDINAILSTANRLLYGDTSDGDYVTLIFAHLDPQTRSLSYSSAGHPTGFVLTSSGEVKGHLASTACPLGLNLGEVFPIGPPIALEEGDLVLLITDGVKEALSPDMLFFGQDQALEIVRAHRQQSAQEIVETLCKAARAFCGTSPQRDDITAVVIKVQPRANPPHMAHAILSSQPFSNQTDPTSPA